MDIMRIMRVAKPLAVLCLVAGCGQEEQATSATALEASSGTTDAEGRVSFKSGSDDLQVSVQDEHGKPLAGMSVQHLEIADQQGILVAYDLSGKYYPNVAFDSAMHGRREGSLKVGVGKAQEQSTLLLETVIVLGLADLAYAIYKDLSESLPAPFVKGGPNVRFCASRAWFERETKIATGVLLMAAPGGTIVKKGIGFATNKVVGSMVMKELDDQYGGNNAGYTVVVPTGEPVCDSGNVVNDLCVLNDQASGLKIWNTAPFVVSTEGPCDPGGGAPSPVASSGPRCDGAQRLCDDFSESANTTRSIARRLQWWTRSRWYSAGYLYS